MKNLTDIDRKNIWHPFTPLESSDPPIVIASAEGVYLNAEDGRKIIDGVSSWWVNIHGHSNQVIAKAIATQALELEHVIFAGFTHKPAIKLSENLLAIFPSNQSKIFFSDNGSTAVEVGLKMAIQYWHNKGTPKTKIVAINGAYHGDTFGSMSVGERGLFTGPFAKHLFETSFIDFPGKDHEEHSFQQFKSIVDNENVAAFIYEPLVQGAAGMRIYSSDILEKILNYAKSKNIICIADEVFTGFGRTGKIFASDYLHTKPDIFCVSKGITGGVLPLGVTSCSDEIIEAFKTSDPTKTFFHGHSYTANPISCAAANASFEILMSETCQTSIVRISTQHKTFADRISNHRNVLSAKSLGTILSIEIKTTEETSYLNSKRKTIYKFFLENNILLRPLGNVIYVLPPYVITNEQLNLIYNAIEKFLDQ